MLPWSLNSKDAQATVQKAVDAAQELIADLHLRFVCFDEFGKGIMKKWRVSPDAYIQQVSGTFQMHEPVSWDAAPAPIACGGYSPVLTRTLGGPV